MGQGIRTWTLEAAIIHSTIGNMRASGEEVFLEEMDGADP